MQQRIFILGDFEKCKAVFIIKSMNEEERQKYKELKEEANRLNYMRTTGKTKNFRESVIDNRIMKWYIKKTFEKRRKRE